MLFGWCEINFWMLLHSLNGVDLDKVILPH